MSEKLEGTAAANRELVQLQASIELAIIRRAAELSSLEKFRLGADLHDDGVRWLRQVIQAMYPTWNDDQVTQELDRRRAMKRLVEEAGLFCLCEEDAPRGEIQL